MNNKLINDNEIVKATIGYGYVKEILSHTADTAADFISGSITNSTLSTINNISKTFGIVTDKRVYCFGKTYESINGKITSTKGRKVIDIEDITGTSTIKASKSWMLLIGLIALFISIIIFIVMASTTYNIVEAASQPIFAIWILITLIAIIFNVLFRISRTNYLSIEYAGGGIRLHTYMESEASIENFQNTIIELKDKIKDSKDSGKIELNVNNGTDEVDELKKAQQMLQEGLINEEDYNKLKSKILGI